MGTGYYMNPLCFVRVDAGEERKGECGYFMNPL
jgi:hypothetical protein